MRKLSSCSYGGQEVPQTASANWRIRKACGIAKGRRRWVSWFKKREQVCPSSASG